MNRFNIEGRAFTLVEVTLALAVSAFALLTIFALLPLGLRNNRDAIEQTTANGILTAVASDLRAVPPTRPAGGTATSTRYGIVIPANPVITTKIAPSLFFTGEGKITTTEQPGSRYRLTVSFLPNGPSGRAATRIALKVSWPAAVAPENALGFVGSFIAIDRN